MPTLLENGRPVADSWLSVADDAALPAEGKALVTLARWTAERDGLAARTAPLGVLVPGDTRLALLVPDLPHFALIAIHFPKFRDGRGFTLARSLREHRGYTGELRATGHLLPDQYQHLVRCGFSTVEVADDAKPEVWAQALGALTVTYQGAVQEVTSISPLRRYLAASP